MAENHSIEYKSTWRDEYLKWVCGFANAQGGALYIGVDDNGKIVDLGNVSRLLEDLPNKISSTMGILAAVRLRDEKPGRPFIEIEVAPQAFPVSYKGSYYLRVGSTNQLLKGVALDTFLLRKQGRSWDASPVLGLSCDELSKETIMRFVSLAQGKGRIPNGMRVDNPVDVVRHLHLQRDGYLTHAAALLFHPEPVKYVSGSTVKIGYFEGDEIVYQDEIDGPIIEQADKVIELLYSKYLKAKITYDGIRRVERYPFPQSAIREVIVNAIAHKNYVAGAPVQIRVYEDRLIVANPCILPDGWDLDSLLGMHASEPHNPLIANAFFLAGQIESWGRGVQLVFAQCKLDGIHPPEYWLSGGSLLVSFRTPADRVVRTRDASVNGKAASEIVAPDTGKASPTSESGVQVQIGKQENDLSSDSSNRGFSANTVRNIELLRERLSDCESFGRKEVVEELGGSYTRAGDLIRKMYDAGFIVSVKGKGKGRYAFLSRE